MKTMMKFVFVVVACLITGGANAQTTYTWTGANTGGDAGSVGDWTFAGNWDGNGVPVDSDADAGLSFAHVDSKIVFATTTLPSSNIPDIGGTASGGKESPIIDLRSGGTLTLTAGVGRYNGFFSNSGGGRTLLFVGDGVGGTDDVTLSLDLTGDLNRHSQYYHDFTIKSDGTLNFTSTAVQKCAYSTSRNATFTMAGGTVSFAGGLSNFGAGFPNSYADFTVAGSTFTAQFGGDFDVITDVTAEMGDGKTFRSSTALLLNVVDNEDGSFTVSSAAPVEGAITVVVLDADAAEEGSDPGTIRISRGSVTSGAQDVFYTISGTADTNDYTESYSGTATIPDGTNSVDLVFTPVDETLPEPIESIILTINTDDAYVVGLPSSGTITITDNDGITVEVLDSAAAEEGSDPGTIRISRGGATTGNLDVSYALTGTADSSDYTESYTSPVTIPDGTNSVDLVFTPVDDLALEGDQTIILTITADSGYEIGVPSSGSITIADNEEIDISSVTAGSWTNESTWSSVVPDAQRTVYIKHAVTIDSVVDDINVLTGDGNGNLIMDGGTLRVLNGGWNSLRTHSLSNGSTLAFNTYTRFQGAVTLDDSTLTFGNVVDFRGSVATDMTIANGSTFITPKIMFWDVKNHAITIDGSGNSVTNGYHDTDGDAGTMTYKFVMDGTDAALSTFNYTTLDLDCENYTWNLVVDTTEWNRTKGLFTLFDCTTLTGTFNNIQFIGGNYGADNVIYDTDNGLIMLDIGQAGTLIIIQ